MSAGSNRSIVVVGGGMLGMTLALRLRQAGMQVSLLESRPHLGGLADAWSLGEIRWDRHYHVTLLSDSYLRDLLRELDIEDRMRWVKTKTGFFTDGKLYSMSNSIEFLRFPPLGLFDKFRLGATIWLTSRFKNWRKLEGQFVMDYLTRLSGKRTAEKIWRPLLKAKLGENYRETSAAFIWATINRLYAARRSGLKEEMFGYMEGGYATTLDAMAQRLQELGVRVLTDHAVERVVTRGDTVSIITNHGVIEADQCVLTIPSAVIAKVVPEMTPEQRARHEGIKYQGILCASVLLKRSLSEYYVTNITDAAPFTGVIEMTAMVSPEELGGHHLIYLPKYVLADSDELTRSDEEIQETFSAGLKAMHPDLQDDDIVAFRVSRAKYVMPIPTLHYSESLPAPSHGSEPVFVVNGAQLPNATLNVNEIIRLAEEAADELLASRDSK